MPFRKINLLLLIFTLVFACQNNADTSEERAITGQWMMHAVYQNGQDVTQEHNPENDRYIIFKEDGSFESGGSPWGKNTGKYQYQASQKRLFLDSDAGEEDDSRWLISLEGDTLSWQGIGTEWAEAFQIVNVKK